MTHKFDLQNILLSHAFGYKGSRLSAIPPNTTGSPVANGYTIDSTAPLRGEFTESGSRLRAKDKLGRWYFMPVVIKAGTTIYDLPCAVISIAGKKNIVETPLVGRKGSVKELISTNDYEVSIVAVLATDNHSYPEEQIARIMELYNMSESVELRSALTDLVFDEGDKVVLKSISLPSMGGVEDAQVVKLECVTDKPLELTIE